MDIPGGEKGPLPVQNHRVAVVLRDDGVRRALVGLHPVKEVHRRPVGQTVGDIQVKEIVVHHHDLPVVEQGQIIGRRVQGDQLLIEPHHAALSLGEGAGQGPPVLLQGRQIQGPVGEEAVTGQEAAGVADQVPELFGQKAAKEKRRMGGSGGEKLLHPPLEIGLK